jgi:hypothetical protein
MSATPWPASPQSPTMADVADAGSIPGAGGYTGRTHSADEDAEPLRAEGFWQSEIDAGARPVR